MIKGFQTDEVLARDKFWPLSKRFSELFPVVPNLGNRNKLVSS
jgi:hypothetical protein